VGICEALYILIGAATGEYGALLYGAVLYGVIGVAMGTAIGVGLAILGRFWDSMSPARAWSLGFIGVASSLGLVIARYVVNKVVYLEQGVPMVGNLKLLAVAVFFGLVGLWLVPVFLTRTPLAILRKPKGSLAAWGVLVILTGLFSFSSSSAGRDGVLAPARVQGEDLAEKGNVMLIMVDTLRADHLGTYGHPASPSPHIDAMGGDGVVFHNTMAHASWTRASTASLFSSSLPSAHKTDVKVSVLPEQVTTLAEVLRDRGYVTGGLPNNINVTRSFNFQQGFDWFSYQAPTYIAGATESASQLSMYNVVRKVRDRLAGEAKRVEDYYQPADTVLANAKAFIEANGDQRWFLFVHLMEPHDPYFHHPYDGWAYGRAEHEVPDAAMVDELMDVYVDEIRWMDTELGGFFDWMKAEDLYDNTTIALTSDHGEEFLEHGGWWHGTTLYDEQIRIPLVMKLAGGDLAGLRVDYQVRQMDIPVTLAMLSGAQIPDTWQGEDLFDSGIRPALEAWITSEAAPALDGDAVDDAEAEEAGALSPPDFAMVAIAEENFEGNVISSIRSTEGWKYIRANEGNPRGLATEELYNTWEDHGEQANLVGREGARQAELASALRGELELAMSGGVEAETTEISDSECQKLLALGYVDDCSGAH